MRKPIREIMTSPPRTVDARASVLEAAQVMSADRIGDVIVCDGDTVCGILTDRDITIRVVAQGKDPAATRVGDICSKEVASISPRDTVAKAVRLMREKAVRRIPVLEEGKPVGVVSLGDVALDRDGDSALADISRAPANA